MESSILPSAQARHVYNMMVVRATPCGGDLLLSLARSIELSVALSRRGDTAMESTAVYELQEAAWISPVNDGGWKIA